MIGEDWEKLSSEDKALVAIAVLLDGSDAPLYLSNDGTNGALLAGAAGSLAELDPDTRMPLLGTLLRMAIGERSQGGSEPG